MQNRKGLAGTIYVSMESILKIPSITIQDMTVIMELQKATKSGKLFSYLGGGTDEQQAE